MNNSKRSKLRFKAISLVLLVFLTGFFSIILRNNSNSSLPDDEIILVDKPKHQSIIGEHPWWNKTYRYRQLINVTNPYSGVTLNNYGVNITFDYTTKDINETLQDIRIIEYKGDIPYIRKYYFQKDYPSTNFATVWFETNVSGIEPNPEIDTYLYYGNDNVLNDTTYFMDQTSASVTENFGWIKNGGFEQDIDNLSIRIDNITGWHYADDVSDDIAGRDYIPKDVTPTFYQHGLSSGSTGQEEIGEGTYAFKWGSSLTSVASGGDGRDYVGTLYSTPFLVPEVSGDIGISVWRNIRTYDMKKNENFGYFAVISDPTHASHVFGDVNTHQSLFYGEAWDTSVPDTAALDTWVYNAYDSGETRNTDGSPLGGLGGKMDADIDVSGYKGKVVFLEFGFWASKDESQNMAAFGQIDDVKFNYTLQTDLNEIQSRMSEVNIIVKDVDGRIVPNAKVSLLNDSLSPPIPAYTSENNGSAFFTGVQYGRYNISVNYTINAPGVYNETVVFDSRLDPLVNFTITESVQFITLPNVNIWTIDFEIVDYDKEPLNYGYIEVNYTKGGVLLDNLTLDPNGKATFRWKNQSSYYYTVYYDNSDYNLNPTTLNASYIHRSTYEQNNKDLAQTLDIKQLNLNAKDDPVFNVSQRVYTNGSLTELGNKKITHANINISLLNQDCDFTSVRIYYIDIDNSTEGNLIYENTTYVTADIEEIIDIDVRSPPIASANLPGDSYEVYGLLVELIGDNSTGTTCDGVINVNFTETTNVYNVTDLVKLNIKIVDTYDGGVPSCFVNVNSTDGRAAGFDVDLKTDIEGTGYTFGQGNTDVPFWYLRGYEYNFTLTFLGDHVDVNVTESDQWKDFTAFYYNYTLWSQTNITLKLFMGVGVVLNLSKYQTMFEYIDVVDQAMWDEDVTVSVNFTKTDDDWVDIIGPVNPPAVVNCTVRSTGVGAKTYFTLTMVPGVGEGIFTVTFNLNQLSAGTRGGEVYSIIVSGTKESYINPSDVSDTIYVEAVPTILSMHDYDNTSIEIDEISEVFGESINLTVKYYNETLSPFTDAILTYEWLSLDPIQFYEDPNNAGYYTTSLNTSLAEVWGLRSITVKAIRENYTRQTFLTSLSITERPTSLNGESDLVYLSSKVWVQDPNLFEFDYQDTMISENIGNLTSSTYIWEQLYSNETRIPGLHGTGDLVQNINTSHVLDFKTELKEIGNYYLYVTLHRQNYKAKSALINLEIKSREFSYALQPGKIIDGIMEIENGDSVDLSMSLNDLTRNISLQGATVSLSFQNVTYPFTEGGSGSYSVNIQNYTRLDDDATSETSTSGIIISKANFTTQIIDVTVLLNNRIFDYEFSEEFQENLVKVISGKSLTFDVTLENSKDQSLINDATITLTIDEQPYDINIENNGDGTYTFSFLKNYPKAFTSGNTLSGEITIQRTNYKTVYIPITIQINMEEIFPNVPTFYFILITAAVLGVVGSIVAYRVIQQARIPKHVKKIRKVKSLIKSKKKIADIPSIPSKNEMIAKIFGEDWKRIGLEIGDSLGLKDIKAKKLSLKQKEPLEKIDEKKLQKEKIKKDKLEKKRLEREKKEQEKLEKERLEKEKLEKEKLEKEKLEDNELPKERGESN